MLKSIVVAAALFCAGIASAVEVGDQSACVRLPHLDGSSACINEGPKQYVLVEFSSAFCGACRVNVPLIKNLANDIGANTYTRFVYSNNEDISRDFARRYQIGLPFAVDSDKQAFSAYEVVQIPTLMVVDSAGKVVYVHAGVLTDESVAEIRSVTGN